jgi:outer membrane protein OmpA-like peptidoglycan-associated protein
MERCLVVALLLSALPVTGCATGGRPAANPPPASTSSAEGARTEPATASAPYTNTELADELRRQGVGVAATATAPPSDDVPEIRETPRGVVVTLPHTQFAFDSSDLDARARRVVERMAYVLNHPRAAGRTVILEGHADAIGTQAYNLALSRRRAETVARELIGQGVRRDRVTVEAYGESRPVAPNQNPDGSDDPAGRARNRRVEAVIRN